MCGLRTQKKERKKSEFKGLNFGANKEVIGELFFNTSMVGYQDILSDPSYYGKIACMTSESH